MKKNLLKTFFLTAAMAVGMTAQAQTDVTSQYVVNPGFEACTPSEGNLATSKEGLGVDYSDAGWTFLYDQQAETWSMSAVFAYGTDGQINGAPIPATDNAGNSGNALGISVGWSHAFYYQSAEAVTLPVGHYELTVYAYNANGGAQQFKSLLGFVPTEGTAFLSTKTSFASSEWVTDVVSFDITEPTEGKFQIGGQAVSGGSGSNAKIFFDNISLTWSDPLSAFKASLQNEIEAAEALLGTEAFTEGQSDLSNAIAAAVSALASATTAEELGAALEALQQAEQAFLEANMLSKQKYIIQNVSAAFEEDAPSFWGVGNSWGTQATLVPHPEYVTLIPMPNGKYWLESQVANKENSWYFNGDFMDQTPAIELTISKVAEPLGYIDDDETIPLYTYTIANGNNYFGWDGESTVLGKNLAADSENALWIIASLDEAKAGLSAATEEDPMDATFLIEDHDFGRNNRNQAFWNVSEDCTNKNLSGGNNINNCAESYHSVFTISQTIEGAPAGVYELAAQGFYREDAVDGGITTIDYPVFVVNDETASFPVMGELPDHDGSGVNSMGDASVEFAEGNYTIEPIRFTIAEGEPIVIGTRLEQSTNLWCIFDNFTLLYYGSGIVDGIETVGSNVSPKSNAIYTLGGQRVNNAQKGIYIINGKKVVK